MDYSIDRSLQHERIIILLDLDFFYGQVEQVRDPRLQGLPFVIKQKHIVVTASYPARKRGVKKLQLWTDAKKLCPEIITIVGEDLTQYRIASREIREYVTSFVKDAKVEKLGLDELFLDVTEQINEHLDFILPSHPQLESIQTFQVDSNSSSRSFTYPFGIHTGFLEPTSDIIHSPVIPYSTFQIFVASHFAQYIREQLFSTLGYTTSAGIASTKLVAKLLSDLHKPALQSLQNPSITLSAQQSWLDTFKVEKLNGFGYRTGSILRNKLLGEELPTKGIHGEADKHNGSFLDPDIQSTEQSLSVGKVRTSSTLQNFLEWFGSRLGSRLWSLLHGIDDTKVVATPSFPKQISVEDSFPDNCNVDVLFDNLHVLIVSLVRRLDFELVYQGIYIRFPRTLRLSMRNGHHGGRESKSTRMPVELYDLTLSKEKRIEIMVRTVNVLARGIIAGWTRGWRVGVINVCATELGEEDPGRGIQGFIGRDNNEIVDWDIIRELPEDIRNEVLRQYHLSPERLVETTDAMADDVEIFGTTSDDEMDDWDDDDTKETCSICKVKIFSWMTDAHRRYHIQQTK